MPRRSSVRMGVAVGLALAALPGCGDEGSPDAAPQAKVEAQGLDPALASRLPPGASFASAEEGRTLFAVCATCHGFDGAGTQLAPSLRDTARIHDAEGIPQLEQLIRAGVPEPEEYPVPMPPHGGGQFSDAQIRALATYVYLLGRSGGGAPGGAERAGGE